MQNAWAIAFLLLSEVAVIFVSYIRFGKYPATHSYLAKFYGLCLLAGIHRFTGLSCVRVGRDWGRCCRPNHQRRDHRDSFTGGFATRGRALLICRALNQLGDEGDCGLARVGWGPVTVYSY